MTDTGEPLRIGILGAARITALSLVEPAHATGHRLVCVAARSPQRARAFATKHGVERVHQSYADVLADPEVEVVYNPLPNAMHARWNLAALTAGKHVLAEKPSAANAREAAKVAEAAESSGQVFMEAFHYPYHPLFQRVCALLADGAIGTIEQVQTVLRMPPPPDDDPRWSPDLGGGATMDLGCYSLSCLRLLGAYAGGEPRLLRATAAERSGRPGVDERLMVEAEYPSGAAALGGSDMAASERDFRLVVRGSLGELVAPMFAVPSEDDSLVLRRPGQDDLIEHLGRRSSYVYQLETFAAAVRSGARVLTDAPWSVSTMQLIDAAYELAGLSPRTASSA